MNSDGVDDVAMILVKEADSDRVAQILQEASGLLKLLPSFLIAILDHTLPHLPPWSQYPGMVVQKDALGSMIANSVGGFGCIDVYNSFFGSTGSEYGRTSSASSRKYLNISSERKMLLRSKYDNF